MFWQVVSCVLAAAGILLFLWCLVGAFVLPVATPGLTAVYRARGEARDMEQAVRGFAWLRGTGVLEVPLQIVDCGMNEEARQRAEHLARRHPYIQIMRKIPGQGEETVGETAGTDPRQCGCRGVSK